MTSVSFLVHPLTPTGQNRRIELAGLDLWQFACINNVFVYPSEINLDRFKDALARSLALWPLIAGIGSVENENRYFIEMCDHPIPVTFEENHELEQWPLDSKVLFEMNENPLPSFYDPVQSIKIFDNISNEPLVRFKMTHLVKTGEWVLGSSWSHILGDAASCLHFHTDLSRLYQQLEVSQPLPVFERPLWQKEKADPLLHGVIKQLRDAKSPDVIVPQFIFDAPTHSGINLYFSGEQLKHLRSLITGTNVTTHDALIAYLISTLNRSCYHLSNEKRILRTNTAVNFRGVSDSIAPPGIISNAVMMMLSDDFDDPYSINLIANTIRRSIIQSRDKKFLEVWLATADDLMRTNTKKTLFPDLGLFPNEVVVNSNHRYDWAAAVDFGYSDQCRFHTSWVGPLYFRIFRQNPKKNGNQWLTRDRDGAEVAFRIEKELKETFLNAIQQDMKENFVNVTL